MTIAQSETWFGPQFGIELLAYLLVAVILTVPLSILVLGRYRSAVTRWMLASAPRSAAKAEPTARQGEPARAGSDSPVAIREVGGGKLAGPVRRRLRADRRTRFLTGLVFAAAGSLHAGIAVLVLLAINRQEVTWERFSAIWLILAWPVAPTVALVVVTSRWVRLFGPLLFPAAGLFFVSSVGAEQYGLLWLGYLGLPTAIALAVANPKLRAVGPMVLGVTFVATFGASMALSVAWLLTLGASSIPPWVGVTVTGGSALILAGLFLRRLARAYERKHTSDQLLVVDSGWLVFTLWETVLSIAAGGAAGFLTLLAFVAYLAVTRWGLRALRALRRTDPPLGLLLLRAFADRSRSERFFQHLSHLWRFSGTVNLIAGPDLATATLEPHEFLDFLTGRLASRFVRDADHLREQIGALDQEVDPDGRFRVNDFFCHDDTWRATLEQLFAKSDVVLMDLRGLSGERSGLGYELRTLVETVPLSRAILMIDEATDLVELRRLTAAAARTQPGESLRIFKARSLSTREGWMLRSALIEAAAHG